MAKKEVESQIRNRPSASFTREKKATFPYESLGADSPPPGKYNAVRPAAIYPNRNSAHSFGRARRSCLDQMQGVQTHNIQSRSALGSCKEEKVE